MQNVIDPIITGFCSVDENDADTTTETSWTVVSAEAG